MLASLALVVLASLPSQDGPLPEAGRVQEALAELRSRSDRYEAVHARYRLERKGGAEPRTVEICYRAPGTLAVRGPGDGGESALVLRDGWVHVRSSGARPTYADIDLRETIRRQHEFRERIDDLFPRSGGEERTGDNEIFLRLDVTRSPDAERPELEFSAGFGSGALFTWLWTIEGESPVSLDEERIGFDREDGIRIVLSRRTGLIEWAGDDEAALVLESATVDEELEDALFAPPDPAEGAERIGGQEGALLMTYLQSQRRNAWLRMRGAFRDRTDFDERAQEVFRALHVAFVEARFGGTQEKLEAYLDELSRWASDAREAAAGDAGRLASVQSALAEIRAKLQDSLLRSLESLYEGLGPVPGVAEDVAEALLALEKDAVRALYRERVVDPALERFDELLGE